MEPPTKPKRFSNPPAIRASRSAKKSKASETETSKKSASKTSPTETDKSPQQQQDDIASQPKKLHVIGKMSIRKRNKSSTGISNRNDACSTKSAKSDSNQNRRPKSTDSEKTKGSIPEVSSIVSSEPEPTTSTNKQENSLTHKEKNSHGKRVTDSSTSGKRIAINAAGKVIDLEYVGDKAEFKSTGAVAMYKGHITQKTARKLFILNLFGKKAQTVSKPMMDSEKDVTKAGTLPKTNRTASEKRKNDTDNNQTHCSISLGVEGQDVQKSKSDSTTLHMQGETMSSNSLEGIKPLDKAKDSDECGDNEMDSKLIDSEAVAESAHNTALTCIQLNGTHQTDEGNSSLTQGCFQQAMVLGSDEHSNKENQAITSFSTETDVLNEPKPQASSTIVETLNVEMSSTATELENNELEESNVSKPETSEDNQFEVTKEDCHARSNTISLNINSGEASLKVNDHSTKKPKFERDLSRFRLPRVFERKTSDAVQNSGPGDSQHDDETRSPHESEDETLASLPKLKTGGVRNTLRTRFGTGRTLERQGNCHVRYMKVHGEKDGAYKNETEPRGLIFIKNFEDFTGNKFSSRRGSSEDYHNLMSLFLQMGYIPAGNLCESGYIKKDKLIKDLKSFAKLKHHKYGSTIIIIMSHGVEDKTFITSDEKEVQLSKVYSILNNNNCSGLRGKPKIFIFQFCRPTMERQYSVQLINSSGVPLNITVPKAGKKADLRKMLLNFFTVSALENGSQEDAPISPTTLAEFDIHVNEDSDTELDGEDDATEEGNSPVLSGDSMKPPQLPSCTNSTPENSDMYSIFATQSGGVAYRDPKTGSLLIQAICNVFSKHAYQDDIDALVRKVSTLVQERIACAQDPNGLNYRNGVVERVNIGLDKLFFLNPYPRGVMEDGMLSPSQLSTMFKKH